MHNMPHAPFAMRMCRFEGSALALLQGKAWVAFDNMFALARLPADLDSSSNSNGDEPVLIGQPAASSQYEVRGIYMFASICMFCFIVQ